MMLWAPRFLSGITGSADGPPPEDRGLLLSKQMKAGKDGRAGLPECGGTQHQGVPGGALVSQERPPEGAEGQRK